MDTTSMAIIVVLILLVIGAFLAPIFMRRQRSKRFSSQFGAEYDHTVESLGSEKKPQAELNEHQKHVESLDVRPLLISERERYLAEWAVVQPEFVEQPMPATIEVAP